jgi:maleylpyruvate isomerase
MAGRAAAEVAAAIETRTTAVVDRLADLSENELTAPSRLPDWTRLTIVCHLRYGADAFSHMTRAALKGEPAAYYPEGRDHQRPGTLVPTNNETAHDVVRSLEQAGEQLQDLWASLDEDQWGTEVREPDDNPDLGPVTVEHLAVLRLTEVEVHGSDLDIGLDDWSKTFVDAALPFRIERLNRRRTTNADDGTWLLRATDGPAYSVTTSRGTVTARPADSTTDADAVIEATSRDLVALLLGRPLETKPTVNGDVAFGQCLQGALPGP